MKKTDATKQKQKKRLPYEPPAVVSEDVFETQALACNQAPGEFGCPGPGRS
jgi:hypothetical protein